MKEKINLLNVPPETVMFGYLYPAFAKEFLLMNDFSQYAEMIKLYFILTPEQWSEVLKEWELKEILLGVSNELPNN